jgi:hypothetical protein
MILNWKTSKADFELIHGIAGRASEIGARVGVELNLRDVVMDVTACHLNGNPLHLGELLTASELDFTHDVWGILQHLDRDTGKLGCFTPRYSAREGN